MSGKPKKKPTVGWPLIAVMIALVGGGVYMVKNILSEDAPRRRDAVATVTLLKPPPPVTIKEKPPELPKEIPKTEEVIDPVPQNEDEHNNEKDNTPAGDKLGLDAEGKAGGDSFGLVGKKGGRSLIAGGGFGQSSLLNKFAGYTQIVQLEVKKRVLKHLDENGGIPKGKLQVVVRLSVNGDGVVENYRILGSSGSHRMDEAVEQTLGHLKISESPPEGMPRTMDIKITSQG